MAWIWPIGHSCKHLSYILEDSGDLGPRTCFHEVYDPAEAKEKQKLNNSLKMLLGGMELCPFRELFPTSSKLINGVQVWQFHRFSDL